MDMEIWLFIQLLLATVQDDDTIRHRNIPPFKILILNMALTNINDGN